MGAHREETVSAGTKSIAPVTIGQVPLYIAGIPTPTIQDSVFGQGDSGNQILGGIGVSVGAGQVAGTGVIAIGKGAKAWGQDSVYLGTNAGAGAGAKQDGVFVVGGGAPTGKNQIVISSQLAFGGAFADAIRIGTQVGGGAQNSVSIGTGASASLSAVAIGDTAGAGEPWGVAIGYHAATPNSGNGTGSKCIAIGYQANAGVSSPGDQSATAIGRSANAQGQNSQAFGSGATVSPATSRDSIAMGTGATCTRAAQVVIGDNTNGPITLFTIRAGAANDVLHSVGASGGWGVRDAGDANTLFRVDSSAVAGDCRMLVWDVSGTTTGLKRVTFGADNSAGAGFKWMRVAN